MTAGTYSFTIQATDSAAPNRNNTATFDVQIEAPLTITTAHLSDTTIGATYQAALAATGGATPYTWTITSGSLPIGLTLKSDGTLSGITTTAGASTFTAQVTDNSQPTAQTTSRTYTINVTLGLSIANNSLPDGYLTTPYQLQLNAAGGLGPYTWSATGLPPGLALSTNGFLSGTPTTTGTYTLNVSVIDAYTPAHSASKPLAMTVRAGRPEHHHHQPARRPSRGSLLTNSGGCLRNPTLPLEHLHWFPAARSLRPRQAATTSSSVSLIPLSRPSPPPKRFRSPSTRV